MTELEGTVAVVTGGAQGIGECIAASLARDGAAVLVGDLQEEKAQAVAARLREEGLAVQATRVDISSPGSAGHLVQVALDRFGRIDLLVNDAGLDAPSGEPWTISEEHWRDGDRHRSLWGVVVHAGGTAAHDAAQSRTRDLHQFRERPHRRA